MVARRYPETPLLGVGAVLFDDLRQHVLLIQRGAPPAAGQWSVPGGLVDPGETLKQACIREAREETGLEVIPCEVVKIVERLIDDDAGRLEYHFVIVDYWAQVAGGSLQAGSDAQQAKWTPLDELEQLSVTVGLKDAVERALAVAKGVAPPTPLLDPEPPEA